jgi:hypothetical protein
MNIKVPKRSLRRHHNQRKKAKAKEILKRQFFCIEGDPNFVKYVTEEQIGAFASVPCVCSDDCCCNPRHNNLGTSLDRLTKQERIDLCRVKEQLNEL